MPKIIHALPVDNRILFRKRDRTTFGFLSNFHAVPIEVDGEKWATVEHFYQAQQSSDPKYREAISVTERLKTSHR